MTPAPQAKRLDARILSKADLDRLSSVAWNYARESTTVRVGDYLQDVASLRGHIDALEAEAAAREEQVRVLRRIVNEHRHPRDLMVLGCRCGWCQIDKALAALTPIACEGEQVRVLVKAIASALMDSNSDLRKAVDLHAAYEPHAYSGDEMDDETYEDAQRDIAAALAAITNGPG